MGSLFWTWIWVALGLSALVVLGLLLKSILNRLLSAAHQAQRLAVKLEALAKLIEEKPQIEKPESSLLQDPNIALARRKTLLKARIKKEEQRQRRLIASLKRFDPNESRFHE